VAVAGLGAAAGLGSALGSARLIPVSCFPTTRTCVCGDAGFHSFHFISPLVGGHTGRTGKVDADCWSPSYVRNCKTEWSFSGEHRRDSDVVRRTVITVLRRGSTCRPLRAASTQFRARLSFCTTSGGSLCFVSRAMMMIMFGAAGDHLPHRRAACLLAQDRTSDWWTSVSPARARRAGPA
jgi:hypothetical protein